MKQWMATFFSEFHKEYMKPLGFKKDDQTFSRHMGEYQERFNFQGSSNLAHQVEPRMSSLTSTQLIPTERVERLILMVRGEKVLLDADLASLYGVTTGALNRAVKRNASRFPADFMFQLRAEEAEILKCQIGISSSGHGGRRRSLPYAFTEQGVAMLSSVLHSERAVQVNVAIMRTFVALRRLLAGNEDLARKLAELECRLEGHDRAIKSLFDVIRQLMAPPAKPRKEIGFHAIAKRIEDTRRTRPKARREGDR